MDTRAANKRLHHYIAVCMEMQDTAEVEGSWGCWESLDDQQAAHEMLKNTLVEHLIQLKTCNSKSEAMNVINNYIIQGN